MALSAARHSIINNKIKVIVVGNNEIRTHTAAVYLEIISGGRVDGFCIRKPTVARHTYAKCPGPTGQCISNGSLIRPVKLLSLRNIVECGLCTGSFAFVVSKFRTYIDLAVSLYSGYFSWS